jgi:hypothetical protein
LECELSNSKSTRKSQQRHTLSIQLSKKGMCVKHKMRCVIHISILTLKVINLIRSWSLATTQNDIEYEKSHHEDTKNPIANSCTRWTVDWYHMDHNNSNGLPVIEIPYTERSYLLSKSSRQDTTSSGASLSPFTGPKHVKCFSRVISQFIGLPCDLKSYATKRHEGLRSKHVTGSTK